jgi:hypothetical protein
MSHLPVSLGIAGWSAGASTVIGLVALSGAHAPEPAFVSVLAGLAWLCLALVLGVAASHVRHVLDEQRVLGARVAPRTDWASQRRASLLVVAATGGALALAVGWQAAVAAAASPTPDSAPVARLHAIAAAATLAGALHALAWMGVLAWWGRAHVLWLAGLCGALSALLALGWAGVQQWAAQAPWLVAPALMAAAWATRRTHERLWLRMLAVGPTRARTPRVWLDEALAGLKSGFARVDPVSVPLVGLVPGQMFPSLTSLPRDSLLFVSWGSQFDLSGVARLALLAAGMCLFLRTGALHWRLLLAPGGRSRGGLAWDIVLRSWLAAVVALALIVGISIPLYLLVSTSLGERHLGVLAWLGEVTLRFGPTLLCEMLLATALAACVRPLVRGSLAAFLVFLVAAFVAFAATAAAKLLAGIDTLPGWPRESAHHLGMLALAGAVTWLAGIAWGRADLRQVLAPRPAPSPWNGSGSPRLTRKPTAAPTRRSS